MLLFLFGCVYGGGGGGRGVVACQKRKGLCVLDYFVCVCVCVREGGVAAGSGHWTQDPWVPGLNPDSASNRLSLSSDSVLECRVQCLVLRRDGQPRSCVCTLNKCQGKYFCQKSIAIPAP